MHVFRTILYFPCLLKSIAGRKIREKLSKCVKIKPIIILKYVCYTKKQKYILHFPIIDLERQASILTFKIATEFGLHNDKHEKPYFILDSFMDINFIIDFMVYKDNLVYNQN